MIVIGLTGSIGMGKTVAASQLRRLGLPVYDADRAVHGFLAKGGAAVPAVAQGFPGVVAGGIVDRAKLGARVFGDPAALRRLEAILHPLAGAANRRFLARSRRQRRPLVVLDIPLLFETGGDRRCDVTIVVSCAAFLQEQRVLARPGMTPAKFAGIRGQQMADHEKRKRADYIIPTGGGRRLALRRLAGIVRALRNGRQRVGRRRK